MTPRLLFGRVSEQDFELYTVQLCLSCGQLVEVLYGSIQALAVIDAETLAVVCPRCLTPESQQHLAELRDMKQTEGAC
ncbi:MAG: hypothetical protein ACRDVG_07750 [Jatrophihabitantaceae bacterium]